MKFILSILNWIPSQKIIFPAKHSFEFFVLFSTLSSISRLFVLLYVTFVYRKPRIRNEWSATNAKKRSSGTEEKRFVYNDRCINTSYSRPSIAQNSFSTVLRAGCMQEKKSYMMTIFRLLYENSNHHYLKKNDILILKE